MDEKISGLEQLMYSLLKVLRWKRVKDELNIHGPFKENDLTYNELYELLRKAGAYQFLEGVCCPMVEEPTLHIYKSRPCPKMMSFECTHGTTRTDKKGWSGRWEIAILAGSVMDTLNTVGATYLKNGPKPKTVRMA